MDSMRGICLGCGRTLDEIARWSSMTDEERARTMKRLALGAPDSSPPKEECFSTAGKMPALPVE